MESPSDIGNWGYIGYLLNLIFLLLFLYSTWSKNFMFHTFNFQKNIKVGITFHDNWISFSIIYNVFILIHSSVSAFTLYDKFKWLWQTHIALNIYYLIFSENIWQPVLKHSSLKIHQVNFSCLKWEVIWEELWPGVNKHII